MWLKPHGYACITSPEESQANLDGFQSTEIHRGANEFDSMSCAHCNRVVHIKARMRPEDIGGFCRQCMKPICPFCTDKGNCVPFEKRLEQMEKRDRALRSYGF
jgi:hypothetical protein